ncbi:Transferase [Parasponia andersonii]|uniref:Transferase n=1 Tax=Parasponia andersonii TaxID=3476 RepID=A0A2P5BBN4_PARAD|nr:Transferase [Parasponia andersonii]
MEPPRSVNVLEVCHVVPSTDLPDSAAAAPRSLPLTFFDILWLRLPPVQRLFFYQTSSSKSSFNNSVIPKLKHSLSLTLLHYLPLAGNLTWPKDCPKPVIRFVDGDGVSLTIAESNMDFYHLSGVDFREAKECHPLLPELTVSQDRAQVIALQVTLFPNDGFSIAITAHHAVLDGKTSMSFMKSWCRLCKQLGGGDSTLGPELTPFYDRDVVKDPAGLEAIYANEWLNEKGPNNRSLTIWELNLRPGLVRGTFELTREDVEKLKKTLLQDSLLHVSTFSLTCSYTWVCLVKALRIREKKTHLGFNVDCRSRLKPALPENYFGNCITGRGAFVETEGLLGEEGLSFGIKAISKAIKSLDDGVLNRAEILASIIIGAKAKTVVSETETRSGSVSFAGSPRFEVYGIDFGWGRPRKVEMTSVDRTGAICISDSRNGNGGVEIGLVLKLHEMEAFASEFSKGLAKL